MKEMYYENLMSRVKEELKFNKNSSFLSLEVAEVGDKVTIDGINYFDSIRSFHILSHGTPIAIYYIDEKKLKYFPYQNNIIVTKDMINFLNNYYEKELFVLNNKGKNRLLLLESKKEELDPECALSDYEISLMMNF